MNLTDGYEIYKIREGKKVVLVWWDPDDCQNIQLPTTEELFDEAIAAAKLVMREAGDVTGRAS